MAFFCYAKRLDAHSPGQFDARHDQAGANARDDSRNRRRGACASRVDKRRLSARVASMISADCLVLLSDIDGLYTEPPGSGAGTLVREVRQITPEIEAMAGSAGSELSRGGMVTKIEAGRIALASGANM